MSHIEFNESFTTAGFNPSNLFQSEWSELQSARVPRGSIGEASWALPDLAIVADTASDWAAKRPIDRADKSGSVQPIARKVIDSRRPNARAGHVSPPTGLGRDKVSADLPELTIDERDRFLERLCAAARDCSKSDFAVSILVQEAISMVGFGAVLNALTIYANSQDSV